MLQRREVKESKESKFAIVGDGFLRFVWGLPGPNGWGYSFSRKISPPWLRALSMCGESGNLFP